MTKLPTRRTVLHVSPHLDDAVLSVGGLIARQVEEGIRPVVATMVTADPVGVPLSPLAERYFKAWGGPRHPFGDRCIEDAHAVEDLGAEWRHMGLLDCTYRQAPSGRIFYDTMESLFSAEPDPEDTTFGHAVARLTEDLIEELGPEAIYTAATIGRHVDHVCVVRAVMPVAKRHGIPLLLWEDQPYATGVYPPDNPDTIEAALRRIGQSGAEPVIEAVDIDVKLRASRLYVSQLDDLFGSPAEMDRLVTAFAAQRGGSGPSERFWKVK